MHLSILLEQINECNNCEPQLPFGCKPLVQASRKSRILVIGQAPGKAAHLSGTPWDDRSGDRLRDWLGINPNQFYDPNLIALMPMGFCFPGSSKSGDLPPRPECAPLWHDKLRNALESIDLTIIAGKYAFDQYLSHQFASITQAVRSFEQLLPNTIALPHPSPRNNIWLKKNPWFQTDALPQLKSRVSQLISNQSQNT